MPQNLTSQSVLNFASVSNNAPREVIALYEGLLLSWNRRDAASFSRLFHENGSFVGFDGSQFEGPVTVCAFLSEIFRAYPTACYVAVLREVRLISPSVALLRAIAGMVPREGTQVNPSVNAVQSLTASLDTSSGHWKIAHFQNTPAALHGRPDLVRSLTEELDAVARKL